MNMLRFLNEVSSLAIVAAAEIYSIGLMPPVAGNEAPIASASTMKRRDSFAVIGVFYAVLPAFVVVAVWED
ncbi:MAG: hypothetical protein WA863_16205 [Methyloceanibacter sp.]